MAAAAAVRRTVRAEQGRAGDGAERSWAGAVEGVSERAREGRQGVRAALAGRRRAGGRRRPPRARARQGRTGGSGPEWVPLGAARVQ